MTNDWLTHEDYRARCRACGRPIDCDENPPLCPEEDSDDCVLIFAGREMGPPPKAPGKKAR